MEIRTSPTSSTGFKRNRQEPVAIDELSKKLVLGIERLTLCSKHSDSSSDGDDDDGYTESSVVSDLPWSDTGGDDYIDGNHDDKRDADRRMRSHSDPIVSMYRLQRIGVPRVADSRKYNNDHFFAQEDHFHRTGGIVSPRYIKSQPKAQKKNPLPPSRSRATVQKLHEERRTAGYLGGVEDSDELDDVF